MKRIVPLTPPPTDLTLAYRLMNEEPELENESRPRRYVDLPPRVKQAVWEHLWAEQSGLCAYCERQLPKDPARTKIEHFHPRRKKAPLPWAPTCEQRTNVSLKRWRLIEISLGNLLLCCDGESNGTSVRTCDTSKDDAHVCEEFYNVKGIVAPTLVVIGSAGAAKVSHAPSPNDPASQAVVDEHLALNGAYLRSVRAEQFGVWLDAFNEQGKKDHRPASVRRREFADRLRRMALTADLGSTLLSAADHIERGG
ncbi:hypothetical protein [Curtobacterium sp. VKM Ac-2852]|uniref:hypothetical protein n=1 Tax=Curtobacterium sp. VKM Ac-2852 TaxID=2739024 RepID=UPI0015633D6B|nr:hypothetical protein [Curtobacterium sp. VKM Ac-2852]NQX24205.1 hypothetical protein [Curtobacterium sp. VKM Ac-2852]